jgi:hypothetical protein
MSATATRVAEACRMSAIVADLIIALDVFASVAQSTRWKYHIVQRIEAAGKKVDDLTVGELVAIAQQENAR